MADARAHFSQGELTKLLKAARAAGYQNVRIEPGRVFLTELEPSERDEVADEIARHFRGKA